MSIFLCTITLILLSGFCSVSEASLIAGNHIKLKILMKSDKFLKTIIENKQTYLGAIICANTIINVSGSVFIGLLLNETLDSNFSLLVNWHILNFTITSTAVLIMTNIAITWSILMFAEMLPKFWASTHPEKVLSTIKIPLIILRYLMVPFLIVTKGLAGIFMKEPSGMEVISKEEVEASIAIGINTGLFMDSGATLLKNAVQLTDHKVSDWVIDDFELKSIPENTHVNTAVKMSLFSKHHRILVNDDNGDITGVVLSRDILRQYIGRKDVNITNLKHDVPRIRNDASMVDLLNTIDTSEDHLALIVDKDDESTVVGVISTNDILHRLAS